ncbi:MAG: choice-of-anchor H family protein [Gammaproteobacteria bacterium]|nr:choice-of-anchor H family protein [Gammaproteobacteria bacterium]NNF62319.1 hypothetical protein [Gammaproteobacteria bacterium]NNM20883.1 hypothetical protein [Gammaproteobacteria bacterium]
MNRSISGLCRLLFVLTLTGLALPVANATAAATDARVRAAAGFTSGHAGADRFATELLQLTDVVPRTKTAPAGKQSATTTENAYCCAYYIYSARTDLFDDFDGDGFYSYLRVTLDIDTDHFDASLYLRVFLRGSDGIWDEIFESDVFTIYGNSGLDDYAVESELYAGFPADYYDVLVEVYDAYSGALVVEHGPREAAAFSLLPMEDLALDARNLPPTAFSSGGGGSLGYAALLFLLTTALWRSSVRRNRAGTVKLGDQGRR